MDTFGDFTQYLQIFIGLVAGISLLVAVMVLLTLCSFRLQKRIKEIGVEKLWELDELIYFYNF